MDIEILKLIFGVVTSIIAVWEAIRRLVIAIKNRRTNE